MKELINSNRITFFLFFIFLLVTSLPYLFFSKTEIHIFLNAYHSTFFDFIFKYITHIGDGIFICGIGIIFLFINYRYSFVILFTYIFSGLITQIIKRFIFYDVVRPTVLLEKTNLHLIEGVKQLHHYSFPSGHSSTAFALFLCLSFFSKSTLYKSSFLFFAVMIAFSRVYLSQHFLIDISVGSLIGLIVAVPTYLYFNNIKSTWLNNSVIKNVTNE